MNVKDLLDRLQQESFNLGQANQTIAHLTKQLAKEERSRGAGPGTIALAALGESTSGKVSPDLVKTLLFSVYHNEITTIKCVREMTTLGLSECRDLVASALSPEHPKIQALRHASLHALTFLRDCYATIEIESDYNGPSRVDVIKALSTALEGV